MTNRSFHKKQTNDKNGNKTTSFGGGNKYYCKSTKVKILTKTRPVGLQATAILTDWEYPSLYEAC